MDKIFVVQISDSYPESYWFKCKVISGQDPIILKKGEKVEGEWVVEFHLNKKVSVEQVVSFDFFFSDGPNFISPKLYDLMIESQISGVQFIDAGFYVNGKKYEGYKVINFTNRIAAFDEKNSKSEPLLSYIPDGPKKYTEIVLRSDLVFSLDMFRSSEDFTTILAVNRVKELFELNKIVGVQFRGQV